jgi:surfeit locus 1 family protein
VSASRRVRELVLPGAFALAGITVLIGLGLWQVERKAWKEDLIAALTERLAAAPAPLPPQRQWNDLDPARDEFRSVNVHAEFLPGQDALIYTGGSSLRSDVSGAGYWVFTPARVEDGGTVVVNRGFVPQGRERDIAAPTGTIDIIGALRWPEPRGLLTPNDDPAHNLWFARDQIVIAADKKWGDVAPFYLDMERPAPADGNWPRPGALTVKLPNNHLGYALTWFGLAAALAGVFVAFAWKRLRE